ncbi:MAG: O-methyltransferase [Solirubrobacterales bacterium]
MSLELWTSVDRYVSDTLVPPDEILEHALAANAAADLPAIDVSPAQGRLLEIIAKIHGARRILEVGTLGGYSTIWLARALPAGGKVVTLELEPKYAEVAANNLAHAGLANKIDLRIGPAIDSLDRLIAEDTEPFDLTFIDADKQSNRDYFERACTLSRPGSVIIVDNVVRDGKLVDPAADDAGTMGSRALHELLTADPSVTATTIQTVGAKGYDGFTIAVINS